MQKEKKEAMKFIQQGITEAEARKVFEARQARLAQEIEENERMEVERIKEVIARELRKQYRDLVEQERQVLGDVRDTDVRDQERVNRELEEVILESELNKMRIKMEIEQFEKEAKTQISSQNRKIQDQIGAQKKESPQIVDSDQINMQTKSTYDTAAANAEGAQAINARDAPALADNGINQNK